MYPAGMLTTSKYIIDDQKHLQRIAGEFAGQLFARWNRRIDADSDLDIDLPIAVLLSGPLGVGKTCFVRALLQAASNDSDFEVPSPTFNIIQPYEINDRVCHHIDLYRINDIDELTEIGFSETITAGVSFIEWPEKAGDLINQIIASDRVIKIDLDFVDNHPSQRMLKLTANEHLTTIITRSQQLLDFLHRNGIKDFTSVKIAKDASARDFYRVHCANSKHNRPSYIAVDWPRIDDKYMLDYAQKARLATTTSAYYHIATGLNQAGLSAPVVFNHDRENGFMLIEDLGDEKIVTQDNQPIIERYLLTVDALAQLHSQRLPQTINNYQLPAYTIDMMLTELALFSQWYWPYRKDKAITKKARQSFIAIWRDLLSDMFVNMQPGWILRDVHSPNIIYLPNRDDIKKIGFIDIQDALWGSAGYDLASLVMDARTTISTDQQNQLKQRYHHQMNQYKQKNQTDFSSRQIESEFNIIGGQRLMRIMGLFVRLNERDGRNQYLAHLPRVEQYLSQLLTRAELRPIADWLDEYGLNEYVNAS